MSEMQTVVFSLNNEMCGVDTSQVQEIVKYQNVTKVPEMPDFIEGIINLRGKVIPIVNLNTRFGLGKMEVGKKTKIIITKVSEGSVGFIVNDVSEIIKLADDQLEVPPHIIHKAENSYLKSVGKKGEQLISILDLSRILTEEEVNHIENVR